MQENTAVKETVIIHNTPYKGKVVPKVGGGWARGVGSDTYGGTIVEVSPDLTWFRTNDKCNEYAKFDHRKNSIHHGRYVFATCQPNGKLKYEKTCHCVRCENMNVCYVCDKPQTTYYDPSF